MNAFDATRAGTGDTGLASLFAATSTPANAQLANNGAPAATPFAQLLDQLNTLPVPQGSGAPTAFAATGATMAEAPAPSGAPGSPVVSASPIGQVRQAAGEFAQKPGQAERATVRPTILECGLRLAGTGKMLPLTAEGGTILPAKPTAEELQGEAADPVTEAPVADQPIGSAEESARPLATAVVQPINQVQQAASAIPVVAPRSAGSGPVRADTSTASGPAPSPPAGPSSAAAPAVTMTAADPAGLPSAATAAVPDRASREVAFVAAPSRPAMPVTADLHGPATTDPLAATAPARAEPQQMAMQDLTQIVERLTAAREAAAPAATQLAVEHAEFGPLSLSIQQGERGELAIAVAAADRDSQAALVAAIAQAEAPGFEQAPERRGSESAQRDAAAAGQNSDQRGQGGQGGQRDRLAGQQQRQPMPQREPQRERDGETRSGTYA